jgi:hypothetical protein
MPSAPRPVTGRSINERFLAVGIVPLINLDGSRLLFYPRGAHVPAFLMAYLKSGVPLRSTLLRDYLVNVARGITHDVGPGDIISPKA